MGTTGRNTERLDFYRSMDFRVTRKFNVRSTSLDLFLELSNAFGRHNPCCVEYEIEDEDGEFETKLLDYMPLIPSVGFVWRF